jgi:hypothetical protein
MSRKAGVRAGAVAATLATVLALAATAIAAGGVVPTLLSPNHKHVAPGHIRLVVGVPQKAAKAGVFITIANKRKLDNSGHLKECGIKRCDFVSPKHWKGNKYSYVAPFNYPGYWAVTPGKYYWQVHYYAANYTGVYWSTVGSFVVK